MTNAQQMALGSEQPQEEVQLTELLPVEQSRIKETSDGSDTNTTDALKALRSFSHADEDEFPSRAFDYCSKIDRFEERVLPVKDPNESAVAKGDGRPGEASRKPRKRVAGKKSTPEDPRSVVAMPKRKAHAAEKDFAQDECEVYNFRGSQDPGAKQGNEKGSIRRKRRKKDELRSDLDKSLTEKDLRNRISAIIEANLMERDNNNETDPENRNKGINGPSSAASESSTSSRSFDEKSKEEPEEGKEVTKKYNCVMCSAKFKGSGGLRNHYKVVHAAGPSFKCDECGKEFPLKERLKLHVRTHTGFKPYKCTECDKSFARGGQLVQHRRTHSHVRPYRCALCSGTFTCAANLALHVKRHNGQKDHKCEICGRGFVRRDALKKHLECLHRDVKSFLCVICNKTFKGHLPQHMRTHAQDRPHGCATCGQRFAQKSQLTVHQRTHSGQRPFRCLVCWQAFAHSTALKLHTRRHTGERPFKCAECNAGFTQLPHWKKHMKCIHGRNEPYCCKNCNSFFRIKNDLESHEKTCTASSSDFDPGLTPSGGDSGPEGLDRGSSKFRVMTVERMRLLLAVLLKRISKPEKLDELGFGKRLIDEVLEDSLVSAGKDPARDEGLTELETLRRNLETFLEWTVPKTHWDNFRKLKKSPEEILETLTAT